VLEFAVVLVLVALSWAILERRWSLVLPAILTLIGLVLYLASEPTPPGGGDGDPLRAEGTGLLLFCAPWLAVVLTMHAWRVWSRHRAAEMDERR
jgi:hypothetical protein